MTRLLPEFTLGPEYLQFETTGTWRCRIRTAPYPGRPKGVHVEASGDTREQAHANVIARLIEDITLHPPRTST